MAVQFPNIFRVDVRKGPAVQPLHPMFLADAKANRVGAYLYDGDAPVNVGSVTVSGEALLANGGTVALTGAYSGNLVYVDLPAACYVQTGPIRVSVTVTGNGITTTVVQGYGNINITQSGVVIDPGTVIPSVSALIATIENIRDTLPPDYLSLVDVINDALLSKIQHIEPTNWLNMAALTSGKCKADGSIEASGTGYYTDYIPVTEGDKVRLFSGNPLAASYITNICFYDASKAVVSGGSDSSSTAGVTIPAGVSYVRVTFVPSAMNNPMIVRNGDTTPSAYSAYFEPYDVYTEDFLTNQSKATLQSVGGLEEDVGALQSTVNTLQGNVDEVSSVVDDVLSGNTEYRTPTNWLNTAAITSGYYVKSDGTVNEASSQFYTDYVPVAEGDSIKLLDGRSSHFGEALYKTHICLYNAAKEVISGGTDTAAVGAFTIPAGTAYIRLSCASSNLDCKPMLVRDGQAPAAYSAYFAPYYEITEDFLTPESAEKLSEVPDDIKKSCVKGFNLVPGSTNGTGVYYVSSGKIIFNDTSSYANYHYCVMPVKPNTLYSFNFKPYWLILATDANAIVSSSSSYSQFYLETGNATKLYFTVSNTVWTNGTLIIAEGVSGNSAGVEKPGFIGGFNQLMHDNWYAMTLPPKVIRFTQNMQEKFYYKNMLALDNNVIAAGFGGVGSSEEDGIAINPTSTSNGGNGYTYTVYDENLSVIQNNSNYTGTFYVRADNVQDCSALIIGDSTVAQNTMEQKLRDAFTARERTITLLGTQGIGDNKHEGRSGWSTVDYIGSGRSGNPNPFYNPTTEQFDFSYYMEGQGYAGVDYVVIQLGINDLYSIDFSSARAKIETTISNICAMIDSIKAFNASQKILLNLPTPPNGNSASVSPVARRLIRAKFANYNAKIQLIITKYSDVRCSHCHLILDPMTDINDNIHPNAGGYNKMALEILSQINCWQN